MNPSGKGGRSDPVGGIRDLGDVLDGLFGPRGMGRRHRQMEEIRRAWVEAAGESVAGHTRVRSLREGVLVVDVDSGPLCHRLNAFQRSDLLTGIQSRIKEAWVTDLRFRLGAF
jgi:predicted nucleic acid-binding Zn ribbon protein